MGAMAVSIVRCFEYGGTCETCGYVCCDDCSCSYCKLESYNRGNCECVKATMRKKGFRRD